MQTIAAVLFDINRPLRLINLQTRDLQSGQVLVKVEYSGVCHSQLHEIRGRRGPDRFLPHTLGHEGSGIVIQIGPGVNKVQPGDHVVLSWIKGTGADVPSSSYDSTEGTINSGAISTFMEHAVVSENRLTVISESMPLREAALLGCAIPTGAGTVLNTAQLRAGQSIAIFGLGGIGLSAVLGARMANADPLIGIDVLGHKLEHAKTLGATHVVDASQRDALAEILQLTSGRGVDYAIEAAGRVETMQAAFNAVRDQGGVCILAGNLAAGQTIQIDPFHLIRGKRIVGTWGGETVPDRDIPRYAAEYLVGRLNLSPLITHEYPLAKINQAIADLENGKVGRALIR